MMETSCPRKTPAFLMPRASPEATSNFSVQTLCRLDLLSFQSTSCLWADISWHSRLKMLLCVHIIISALIATNRYRNILWWKLEGKIWVIRTRETKQWKWRQVNNPKEDEKQKGVCTANFILTIFKQFIKPLKKRGKSFSAIEAQWSLQEQLVWGAHSEGLQDKIQPQQQLPQNQ